MSISDQALHRLSAFAEQHMRQANTPGVSLALTGREGLLHLGTYGFADVAAGAPVTPDTLFEIGSISKSFTAIALLQLWEQGRLDLHAPLAHYLPWFHVPSDYGPVTVHHLLSHTAGIIRGSDFSTESRYEVWSLRHTQVAFPPGSHFYYSNDGYKALGLVLEEMLGQSYGEIIRERILDPLGMDASQPTITHDTRRRLAVGYESWYDDRPFHPGHPLAPATWLETDAADGSIASTAADMATYLRMFLNQGQGARQRVVSEESLRLMTQRVIRVPEGDEDHGDSYGYGLSLSEEEGRTVIGHGGGMVGYYASILADLGAGLGVVVLTNGPGEPSLISQFALKLLQALHYERELPPVPPALEPSHVDRPADFAGSYRSAFRAFALEARGDQLMMDYGAERLALEQRDEDRFFVPHPDFCHFLLSFGREEKRVVEAFHGSDWYTNERHTGPATFDSPPEWATYCGHYRSHNPWSTNFRVISRKGELLLVEPYGEEEGLVQLGPGLFRVGKDERSPERISFDTDLGGGTLRAILSGSDYYRTFTP